MPKELGSLLKHLPEWRWTRRRTRRLGFLVPSNTGRCIVAGSKQEDGKGNLGVFETEILGADRVQKARLCTLKSDFETLRMKETNSIDDFAGKLSGMVSKYNSLGASLEDSVLARKLLDSVLDKFLQLVASIQQYSDVDTMPFEEAIGRLKAYEDRLKLRNGNLSGEGSLLLSKTESQSY